MGFLDKIKDKIETEEVKKEEPKKDKKPQGFMQLDVDIFQTKEEIFIIALIAGINIETLDISIENENDVLTLKGKRMLPMIEVDEEAKEYLRQECSWGSFYRQIILPQEVDVSRIDAKVKNGILVLKLPFLRLQKGKMKIEIEKN
ncbi:hypothetical protein C0584_03295 [Candidatus Parcubacteria bacterium]|nr:MAG: hypothetical protein C0584_03295 [Candidatus Parcubacteria bacterium]